MLTPRADPVYVRASVAATCNLTCLYCPKDEGMENRVPATLRGRTLTLDQYRTNLSHLARNGIRGISFTGGEPTLNRQLPELIGAASGLFERVELTTNGRFLAEMLPAIAPRLALLKVSLDSVDSGVNGRLTAGSEEDTHRAIRAIRLSCAAGLRVAVNTVVMRSTVAGLDDVISLCRSVNSEGHPGRTYLSLLDFYYSDERRDFWESEFFPVGELEELFAARYGSPTMQDRFGCRFIWFDAHGVEVRFKDSYGATQRAAKCYKCKRYCQEGIYGLKHSVEGWVTTCPNGDPSLGVYLSPGLSDEEADRLLLPLLDDIRNSQPDSGSFATMLKTHRLARYV